jgi:hypothetical protein
MGREMKRSVCRPRVGGFVSHKKSYLMLRCHLCFIDGISLPY